MSLKYLHLTHHKCGSRWVESICSEVAFLLGKKWETASNHRLFNSAMDAYCEAESVQFLSYTNANYPFVSKKPDVLGFHVIRDPRDIVVSSYFSSLKTHSDARWPALTEHRKQLRVLTKEDGLLLEMEFIGDVFHALKNWNYNDARVLEIKMEDLMSNNYQGFLSIFSHLGLVNEQDMSTSSMQAKWINVVQESLNRVYVRSHGVSLFHHYPDHIPVLNLLGIVHRNRFEGKAGGRKPGQENNDSHYRKGVSGDWTNHFTTKVENRFNDQHGRLLESLGYVPADK